MMKLSNELHFHLVISFFLSIEDFRALKPQYQGMKQTNNSIEFNHTDLYQDQLLNNIVCNVRSSQELAPRDFPHLPNSKEKLNCRRNPIFNDLILLILIIFNCETVVGNKHCSATQGSDVKNFVNPFGLD